MHVHHLKLISASKGSYLLDPVRDLRPVCPNCHAMLHREYPPLEISALRKIRERASLAGGF
jgi:5-methylcytosine-specific restriction protein A